MKIQDVKFSHCDLCKNLYRNTTLSPKDPFENIEAILLQKLIGSSIDLNGASVTYISVPIKDVAMLLTMLNISCCVLCILKNWLNFSKLAFPIHFNLLHPHPSSILFLLELPLWCFSSLANHYF